MNFHSVAERNPNLFYRPDVSVLFLTIQTDVAKFSKHQFYNVKIAFAKSFKKFTANSSLRPFRIFLFNELQLFPIKGMINDAGRWASMETTKNEATVCENVDLFPFL